MILGKIEKDYFNALVIQKTEYKGKKFLDLREHYYDDNGELKPTKKGITLNLDNIDKVIEFMQEGQKQLLAQKDE